MRRAAVIAALLAWLAPGLAAQAETDLGFFEEGTVSGPEVRTFALPLDGGGWTVNCYVAWVAGSKQAVIIDPGAPAPAVLDFIRAEKLDVLAVLHTHGHSDHVGGASFLAEKLSVPFHLHPADRALAERTTGSRIAFTPYPASGILSLGGLAIEVLPTPGHSPGSVCLRTGGTLFSGDTLFAGGIGRAFGERRSEREANLRLEVENIRRLLLSLPPLTRVLPGHGSSTTIGAERAFNRFLK
jgi:glyoxylase-like metal-dependent hydrolase (beta-lactamase superfamily II)